MSHAETTLTPSALVAIITSPATGVAQLGKGHLVGLGTGSKSDFCRFVAHEIWREGEKRQRIWRKRGREGGKRDHVRSQEMLEGKNLAIFLQLPLQ
ncbi:hypothetical protein DPX16_7658 [Anabarilius grahami]|uniref:Uncharacterized protein n=1 Tax=Anabarilius grahami TaxID=495550 RepID=A0A3N0YR97_ANAGA|nr:hypothetical protein DPX16_7658 [Anabarilius grahami]